MHDPDMRGEIQGKAIQMRRPGQEQRELQAGRQTRAGGVGSGFGLAAGSGERDRSRLLPPTGSDPRQWLEFEMVNSTNPASRVAAAKALLELEEAAAAPNPTLEVLEGASLEELERLVRTPDTWPADEVASSPDSASS